MIVIFAPQDDRHALRVADILVRGHGEETMIFDMSDFPGRASLAIRFGPQGESCRLRWADGRETDLFRVRSFWWRRPQMPSVDPRITDPQVRHFTANEITSALYGVLGRCPGMWMNDMNRDQSADYKPRQLGVARDCGLRVPDTLITNDPQAVLSFNQSRPDGIVYKAFNQRGIIWQPTRRLSAGDLARLDALPCAPAIFQEFVPGSRDIRVTVVGDTLFATEFDISAIDQIDHRLALDAAPCVEHILPADLALRVMAFVRTLGLEYGSVDFRLDPDGAYHFFEINTAGEFLYLQDRSGQPIDAAVAAHLARGVPACDADRHPGSSYSEAV